MHHIAIFLTWNVPQSQTWFVGNTCSRDPFIPFDEWTHCEFAGLVAGHVLHPLPLDSILCWWTGSIILKLTVKYGVWSWCAYPWQPSTGVNETPQTVTYIYSCGVILPRPSKVCLAAQVRISIWENGAILDWDSSVLIWVKLALCCDGILLAK